MIVGTPHGRRNPQFLGVHAYLLSINRAGIPEATTECWLNTNEQESFGIERINANFDDRTRISRVVADANNSVGRDSVEP